MSALLVKCFLSLVTNLSKNGGKYSQEYGKMQLPTLAYIYQLFVDTGYHQGDLSIGIDGKRESCYHDD